jgi:hypothetical protein
MNQSSSKVPGLAKLISEYEIESWLEEPRVVKYLVEFKQRCWDDKHVKKEYDDMVLHGQRENAEGRIREAIEAILTGVCPKIPTELCAAEKLWAQLGAALVLDSGRKRGDLFHQQNSPLGMIRHSWSHGPAYDVLESTWDDLSSDKFKGWFKTRIRKAEGKSRAKLGDLPDGRKRKLSSLDSYPSEHILKHNEVAVKLCLSR